MKQLRQLSSLHNLSVKQIEDYFDKEVIEKLVKKINVNSYIEKGNNVVNNPSLNTINCNAHFVRCIYQIDDQHRLLKLEVKTDTIINQVYLHAESTQ